MAAILNSAMLDSDTAIFDLDTLLSSLRFIQKPSHTSLTLTLTNSIWLTWWWEPSWNLPFWIVPSWIQPFCTKKDFTNSFSLNLMMAAIFNSAILNLAILDSAILVFPLKFTHTCQDWFTPFAQKKTSLTVPSPAFAQIKLHSFILTQLDEGSHHKFTHLEFSHFAQKELHSPFPPQHLHK